MSMSKRKKLELALDIITEGPAASIPVGLRRQLGKDCERKLRALQKKHEEWIGTRAVQGLAVGRRTKCGCKRRDLAIVVFVDKKKPRNKVKKLVPGKIRIPVLGSFRTDVGPIGRLECQVFGGRVRPAMPGSSIGHTKMKTQGTFGLVVRKQGAKRSRPFILSNSHVLALDGLARVGDAIIQPGPEDAMGTKSRIATLAAWEPFNFTRRGWPNRVDAAIARVIRAKSVTRRIRDINVIPRKTSSNIVEGMRVVMVGRSSDLVDSGRVTFPSAKVKLAYRRKKTKRDIVRFSDQVICTPYSTSGDSGSVILNDRNEVIGLHTSGGISVSIFNKIEHVFSLLKITLA
jgi:hypothetical protein